jgi:cell wall assembly regulator SMI1
MNISSSLNRIAAWYEANTRPGKFRLASGASDEEVASFENAIGARLPDDVRESFTLHNGGLDHTSILWYGELLSLSQILQRWRTLCEWQAEDGWGLGDAWKPEEIQGPIKPSWWNPKRIPLVDNDGDFLILDLDPPGNGQHGQIIEHSHETGPASVLADGWSQWLTMVANDLEANKYVYVEEEDTVAPPGMYD